MAITSSVVMNNVSGFGKQKLAAGRGVALDSPVDPDLTLQVASDNSSPVDIADRFWAQSDIQLYRWNKLYPYQFVVLRAIQGSNGVSHQLEPGWTFTLPIPPESISITTPFAINTSATLGGIVEEHNGAPFKSISLRGTTGMLPGRATAQQQNGFNWLETIAGGTATQLRTTAGDFQQLKSAVSGVPAANPNIHKAADFSSDKLTATTTESIVAKTTGYYQFQQLQKFLERYVTIKKTKGGRDLRLAFCIWKDRAVYVVTPESFEVSKSGASPMEYTYSLSLLAWRRVVLDTSVFTTDIGTPLRRDPSKLARMMDILQDARRVVQGVSKVAAAVVGDIDRLVFEPLRETVLFAKDVLGAGISVAELPDSIATTLSSSWIDLRGDASSTADAASELNDEIKKFKSYGVAAAQEVKDMTTSFAAAARLRALAVHPAKKPFLSPKANFELMSKTDISTLKIPPAIQQKISKERLRVQSLRRRDFEVRRDSIRSTADRLAIALGAGNSTFEDTYQIAVKPLKTTPTQSDWDALFALNEAAAAMDSFAATGDDEPSARESTMDVMSQLARKSGIAFVVPTSKFAIPFPYGSTLESLALQYLGDAQRWMEIAALNGLRSPYIDEVGSDVSLLVNGSGSEVVIPRTDLYIGQAVYIWSLGARRTKRRITALRELPNSVVVTVDGPADMSLFTTADGAKLSYFAADTVNSQSLIYIPSQAEPAEDNFVTKSIPGVKEFDPMVAAGGVDLLLDSSNDLVITPDGDGRFAIGLTNIIQQTRIAMSTRRGSLLSHPDFGLPLMFGASTADVSATDIVDAVKAMLSGDPMYSRVDAVRVNKRGPTAAVDIAVTVRGTEQPVPISYEVWGDVQTA